MAYLWLIAPFVLTFAIIVTSSYLAFGFKGMVMIITWTIIVSIVIILLSWKAGEVLGGLL